MSGATDFSSRGPRRQIAALDVALVAAAVALLAAAGSSALRARSSLERTRRAADDVRREADALAAKAQALQGRRDAAGQSLLSQILLSNAAPPPRVLARIADALPEDVRLEAIALTYHRDLELELKVVARTPQAYDAFLKRLAEAPEFAGVVPGPETREGEVHATVTLSYRAGDAG